MDHVTRLSPAFPVNMSDTWFELANLEHFWIKRRFEVLKKLWKKPEAGTRVAEIGCGHGLVLKQVQGAYGIQADGFDLNEMALNQADPHCGKLFYYNIHDRNPSLKEAYDTIFLFDVIEHLEDDADFIKSSLFHLKPGGQLIINVPANQSLFSDYDRIVGHQRRYDINMLRELCASTGLRLEKWTYWGFLYVPILRIRQARLKRIPDTDIVKDGFAPQSPLVNSGMMFLGRLEWLPNHFAGTSLMAIVQKL